MAIRDSQIFREVAAISASAIHETQVFREVAGVSGAPPLRVTQVFREIAALPTSHFAHALGGVPGGTGQGVAF